MIFRGYGLSKTDEALNNRNSGHKTIVIITIIAIAVKAIPIRQISCHYPSISCFLSTYDASATNFCIHCTSFHAAKKVIKLKESFTKRFYHLN